MPYHCLISQKSLTFHQIFQYFSLLLLNLNQKLEEYEMLKLQVFLNQAHSICGTMTQKLIGFYFIYLFLTHSSLFLFSNLKQYFQMISVASIQLQPLYLFTNFLNKHNSFTFQCPKNFLSFSIYSYHIMHQGQFSYNYSPFIY